LYQRDFINKKVITMNLHELKDLRKELGKVEQTILHIDDIIFKEMQNIKDKEAYEEGIQKAKKGGVGLYPSTETGEPLWSLSLCSDPEYWVDSFKSIIDAIKFCRRHNIAWSFNKIPVNSTMHLGVLEAGEVACYTWRVKSELRHAVGYFPPPPQSSPSYIINHHSTEESARAAFDLIGDHSYPIREL
jgi:hypothetical protein